MKIDEIVNNVMSFDRYEYSNMLSDMSEYLEEVIFMLKNPNMFTENDKYELLEVFRKTCQVISNDTRGTGTLMKDLEI